MGNYSIILAADLPTADDVLSVVKRVATKIEGVKVALATFVESGVAILGRIRDLVGDKPVVLDLKIADIGFFSEAKWDGTNAKIIRSLAGSGATHVTVHGFPGPTSIAEAVHAARETSIEVLLLPLMSHAGASLFFSRPLENSQLIEATAQTGLHPTFPNNIQCNNVTDGILLLGEAFGVWGYIGPATEPSELRQYRNITRRPIWCPGFGRQDRLGRSLEEQFKQWAEIVGPASAAIVGSAIFKAKDPAAATSEIVDIRNRAVASVASGPHS